MVRISLGGRAKARQLTINYLVANHPVPAPYLNLSRCRSLRTLEIPSFSLGHKKHLDFLGAVLPTVSSPLFRDVLIVYGPLSFHPIALNHVDGEWCSVCHQALTLEEYRVLDEMKRAWGFRLVHCVEVSGPNGEEIVRKLEHKLEVQKEQLGFPPPENLILSREPPMTCYD